MAEGKLTFNSFIANYGGHSPHVLALKSAFVPKRGRLTEKSLSENYGPDAKAAWAEFVAHGGK